MRNPYELPYAGSTAVSNSGLLAKVAGLLAFSMAFTAAGAVVGLQLPGLQAFRRSWASWLFR